MSTPQYKAERLRRVRRLQDTVEREKARLGCAVCGERHPGCLDFHHTNPVEKIGCVSRLALKGRKMLMLAEMKKCKVLCSNCHRKLHYRRPTYEDVS